MAIRLRSSGQKTLGEVTFVARPTFTPGLLPTKREVLEVMLYHLLLHLHNSEDANQQEGGKPLCRVQRPLAHCTAKREPRPGSSTNYSLSS